MRTTTPEAERYLRQKVAYDDHFPKAYGQILSFSEISTLFENALMHAARVINQGDSSWLLDPRIRQAIFFNLYLFGDKKRYVSGLPEITHAIQSAHRAYNFGPRQGYTTRSIENAFVGLNHDTIEDAPHERSWQNDNIVMSLILSCWKNGTQDQFSLLGIQNDLYALSESPDKKSTELFLEKIARINGKDPHHNYSPRAIVIRFLEQFDQTDSDFRYFYNVNNRYSYPDWEYDLVTCMNHSFRRLLLVKEMVRVKATLLFPSNMFELHGLITGMKALCEKETHAKEKKRRRVRDYVLRKKYPLVALQT